MILQASEELDLAAFLNDIYVPNRLGISARTVSFHATTIRLFSKHLCRPATLNDLQHEVVLRWLVERLKTCAPKTVNNDRANLLALWRLAYDRGFVETWPRSLPKAKVPKRLPTAWTIEELGRILEVTRQLPGEMRGTGITLADWWTSLILVFYDTGSRKEALLQVAPSDVNLDSLEVLFSWESDKEDFEHSERISQQTADAIAKHYDPNRDLVWPFPFHPRKIWFQFKAILQDAGLPFDRYRMFHSLRRTHATHVAANGSPEMARQSLGHATQAMTDRYIDPRMLHHVPAVDVLPRPDLSTSGDRQLRLFE